MFYMGVVEDRIDPLELGRVRVRVYGIHNQDKVLMPTETLPWATIVMPTTSASTSGVGSTPNLVEGSFVMVFFMDPEDFQYPVVMGSLIGINSPELLEQNSIPIPRNSGDIGFQDPTGTYPDSEYLLESDLPKNARSGSTVGLRDRVTINGVGGFEEPEDLRPKRRYPYVDVKQTEAGHIQEFDDTPGNERTYNQHSSGTFHEVRPEGSQVNKIVGSGYEIVAKDKNVYVKGICNIYVEQDCNLKVKGDYNIDVEGDLNYNVKGSTNFNTDEDVYFNTNGSFSLFTVRDTIINSGRDIEMNTNGDMNLSVANTRTDNVYGDMKQSVSGTYSSISYGNTSQTIVGNHSSLVYGNSSVAYNANKVDSVFGNYAINVNGTSTIASVGENIISSRQTTSIASRNTVNIYSPSDVFVATGTINLGATSAINYDSPVINQNSNITPIDTGDIEASMDFSIIEESIDAVTQMQPTDEDMMQVVEFDFGENESEVVIEFPDRTGMSTTNGQVSLDDYLNRTGQYDGSMNSRTANEGSSTQNATTSSVGEIDGINDHAYDGEGRKTSNFENVIYRMGPTRNKVVNSVLEELLSNAAKATGVDRVIITSGKQPGTEGGRTGSKRHDTGMAADLKLEVGGKILVSSNKSNREILAKFVSIAAAMGIRAGGMSPGYMGESVMHLDTLGQCLDKIKGIYDASVISTWKSQSWFVDAITSPADGYSPSSSYSSSSNTITKLDEIALESGLAVPKGSKSSTAPKEIKEVAQKLGQALMNNAGFNEVEALAAIACIRSESGLKLVEERGWSGTNNSRIRSYFSVTKKLSDSQLNQIKADKFTFFEYIYGYKTRKGKELGNKNPGDGGNYIGRGLIQITGRYNYEKFAGSSAVSNPKILLEDYDAAIEICVNYLKERYGWYKGKKGNALSEMRWAIIGSKTGHDKTITKDRKFFNEMDRSWLYPEETKTPNQNLSSAQTVQ